jgi:hypothetical protein
MPKKPSIEWLPVSTTSGALQTKGNDSHAAVNTIPSYEHTRISPKIALLLILAMFAVAPVAYRYAARIVYDPDPFTYAEYGKDILNGMKLYSDVVLIDKGPLTAISYAIPQIFSPRNYLAIGTFMGFVLIAQALILSWNFRRNPSAVVAITFLITIFPLASEAFAWFSTEHLSNLYAACNLVIAFSIARVRRFSFLQCFLAGVFTCMAFYTRQTAVISGFVPAIEILLWGRTVRRVLLGTAYACLGGIIAMVVILILIFPIADIKGCLNILFLHSAAYAGLGSLHESWTLLSENILKPVGLLAMVAIAFGLFSRYSALACATLIAGLLTLISPRRPFDHYLVGFFPYAALLLGIGLERRALVWHFCGWLVFAFILCISYQPIQSTLRDANNFPQELQFAEIAHLADKIAPPAATLLVWGPPRCEAIVFASRLPTASKIWILWMMNKGNAPLLPMSVNQVIDGYLANPPTVIAMDHIYLEHARSGIPVDSSRASWELGYAILMKHRYAIKGSLNGYDIAVLENGPATIPTDNGK